MIGSIVFELRHIANDLCAIKPNQFVNTVVNQTTSFS